MELLCIESELDLEPVASFDPAILDDDRLLKNLMFTEERYLITGSYFKCLQTEIKPSMRDTVADWMLEVCEDQCCQQGVFALAMNILDRFLAVVHLRKTQLQLLGAVCLFVASKLRQSGPISAQALVQYTDWSITMEELNDWELLVLSRLKWDVAAIIPNDFVTPLLRRLANFEGLDISEAQANRIKQKAYTMIDFCSSDFNFSILPSSMIAAASIITAVKSELSAYKSIKNDYVSKSILTQIVCQLHEIARIEKELLLECQLQIEQKLEKHCSLEYENNAAQAQIDCSKQNYSARMLSTPDATCQLNSVYTHKHQTQTLCIE